MRCSPYCAAVGQVLLSPLLQLTKYGFSGLGLTFFVGGRRQTSDRGKANVVIINSMGREAFRELVRGNEDSEVVVGEEVDWYGDLAETIIGTVGFSKKQGWGFAIIKPDLAGKFRVCGRQGNFLGRNTARLELLRRMTGPEAKEAERLAGLRRL